MSHTSKETQRVVAAIEPATEPAQTDESSIVLQPVRSEEPRGGERAYIVTARGKEFQKEKNGRFSTSL